MQEIGYRARFVAHLRPRLRAPTADADDLRALDEALTAVVGAVLQESNRTAGTIIGVATSKLVAAGVMAGTFGGIAAFGAAGTGTAIATLSGAAATTATLYWVGSTVGLGVAAGSLIVAGGALAAGVPVAILVRRHVFGRQRTEQDLSPQEQAVLYAALRLAAPVRALRAREVQPSEIEMRIVARQGLQPLASKIAELDVDAQTTGDRTCAAPFQSLAYWPRRRLRHALRQLRRIAGNWATT